MAEDTTTTTEEVIEAKPETAVPTEAVTTTDAAAPADAASATTATKPAKRKKAKRSVPSGQVHVLATFNNTIVTFTDSKGGALAASSAGACGFRGSKKGTAYAAQVAAEKAGQAAKQAHGLSKVEVYVKGIGLGRDAAIRTLQGLSIQVESLQDVT